MTSNSAPKAQSTAVKIRPLTNQVSNTVVKPEQPSCSRHDQCLPESKTCKIQLVYAPTNPFSRVASARPTNAPCIAKTIQLFN